MRGRSDVSIHLMLLFIQMAKVKDTGYRSFNTSHVTLYRYSWQYWYKLELVSIHLMLLFIGITKASSSAPTGFNTSHVTLYRGETRLPSSFKHVSIHLMLLFIELYIKDIVAVIRVSIHLMLLFISYHIILNVHASSFNTSHVTLYRHTVSQL